MHYQWTNISILVAFHHLHCLSLECNERPFLFYIRDLVQKGENQGAFFIRLRSNRNCTYIYMMKLWESSQSFLTYNGIDMCTTYSFTVIHRILLTLSYLTQGLEMFSITYNFLLKLYKTPIYSSGNYLTAYR